MHILQLKLPADDKCIFYYYYGKVLAVKVNKICFPNSDTQIVIVLVFYFIYCKKTKLQRIFFFPGISMCLEYGEKVSEEPFEIPGSSTHSNSRSAYRARMNHKHQVTETKLNIRASR